MHKDPKCPYFYDYCYYKGLNIQHKKAKVKFIFSCMLFENDEGWYCLLIDIGGYFFSLKAGKLNE